MVGLALSSGELLFYEKMGSIQCSVSSDSLSFLEYGRTSYAGSY